MSRIIEKMWAEMRSVPYISPAPGVAIGFDIPKPPRADNNPILSQQPWYHKDVLFATTDQTNYVQKRIQKVQR